MESLSEYKIDKWIEDKMKEVRQHLLSKIGSNAFAVSIDIATTKKMQLSLLGASVHFVDYDRKIVCAAALDLFQLEKKHTAEYVREITQKILQDLGLARMPVRVVSDGAANMRKAFL